MQSKIWQNDEAQFATYMTSFFPVKVINQVVREFKREGISGIDLELDLECKDGKWTFIKIYRFF